MRHLWVEDFNGNNDCSINQPMWEDYYDLGEEDRDYKLFGNLEETLDYLDNYKNRSEFDSVLIDIRFPVLKTLPAPSDIEQKERDKERMDKLFDRYFSRYITRDKFDKHSRSDIPADANAGILLFFALVYHYGYSWDKIAFLSGNIGGGDYAQTLMKLRDLLAKSLWFNEDWTADDDDNAYDRFVDLNEKYSYFIEKDPKDKQVWDSIDPEKSGDWPSELPKRREIFRECVCIMNRLSHEIYKTSKKDGLPYWPLSDQFAEIGLEIPAPFEKPGNDYQDGDKCWAFKQWVDNRTTRYTVTRRSIIRICDYALEKLKDANGDAYANPSVQKFLSRQDAHIEPGSKITAETLQKYFEDVRLWAANLPSVLSGLLNHECDDTIRNLENLKCDEESRLKLQNLKESEKVYADGLLGAIVPMWEKMRYYIPQGPDDPPLTDADRNFHVCRAVLYHARNWRAHQGIKDVDVAFAVFAFLLSVRGIFYFDNAILTSKYESEEDFLFKHVLKRECMSCIVPAPSHPGVYQDSKDEPQGAYERFFDMICNDVMKNKNLKKFQQDNWAKCKKNHPTFTNQALNKELEKQWLKEWKGIKWPWDQNQSKSKTKLRPEYLYSIFGHEMSETRKEVSVGHLYGLFWLTLHYGVFVKTPWTDRNDSDVPCSTVDSTWEQFLKAIGKK